MATEYFQVQSVVPRNVNTKFGPKTAYDILATNGQKYGAGFKVPTVAPRDFVQAEVVHGKYGPDIQSIMKTNAAPAVSGLVGGAAGAEAPAPSPQGVIILAPGPRFPHEFANGSHQFPLPELHGDRTFVRQHAITAAVATLGGGPVADVSQVIERAKIIEAYIAGDADIAEANEMERVEAEGQRQLVGPAPAKTPAEAIKAARAAVAARS